MRQEEIGLHCKFYSEQVRCHVRDSVSSNQSLVIGRVNVYVVQIELRPKQLASPRGRRRTNDFPKTRSALIRARSAGSKQAHYAQTERETRTTQGTVKWFNSQKGFGFIQPVDGSKDVFVHISAVERARMNDLNEGQKCRLISLRIVGAGKSSAANLQSL